ncbi:Hypothetical predicted protein [Octopus vulgaris]|uniref:Uncharacterized protein n=1 Tax=Octopus vulgaris TaxID=6645 RepID=A0AA36BIN4_OCTVU|nr:Hypothetical predicted protein [Octopus vulgaris]
MWTPMSLRGLGGGRDIAILHQYVNHNDHGLLPFFSWENCLSEHHKFDRHFKPYSTLTMVGQNFSFLTCYTEAGS